MNRKPKACQNLSQKGPSSEQNGAGELQIQTIFNNYSQFYKLWNTFSVSEYALGTRFRRLFWVLTNCVWVYNVWLRTLILRNTCSLDGNGYDVAITVLWPGHRFGVPFTIICKWLVFIDLTISSVLRAGNYRKVTIDTLAHCVFVTHKCILW